MAVEHHGRFGEHPAPLVDVRCPQHDRRRPPAEFVKRPNTVKLTVKKFH